MAEIRIPVRIQFLTQRATLGARGFRDVTAFVDTGASRTLISAALAKEPGIRPLLQRGGVSGLHAIAGIGGVVQVPIGLALRDARGRGCGAPQTIDVGISDEVTRMAQADMVLGHDYMQAVPFVARPYHASAVCESSAAPRVNPTRRRPVPKRGTPAPERRASRSRW